MEWTAQEERQILDGIKAIVEVFARSFAQHSVKNRSQAPATPKPESKPVSYAQQSQTGPILPHLIPVTKWSDHHEYPSLSSLRWLIFNAERTGFNKVIRRVGRRVLIDEAAFFQWVEGRSEV